MAVTSSPLPRPLSYPKAGTDREGTQKERGNSERETKFPPALPKPGSCPWVQGARQELQNSFDRTLLQVWAEGTPALKRVGVMLKVTGTRGEGCQVREQHKAGETGSLPTQTAAQDWHAAGGPNLPYTLFIPSRQLWSRAGACRARDGTAVQGLWSPGLRQAGTTITTHLSMYFGA